jgi:precorrin-6A/cobalt-precorrin-6A reductase
MNQKVWLIGGTGDSATIANLLRESAIPLVVTVTTATAQGLYIDAATVVIGCMDTTQMACFCQHHQIKGVIDASHPYATEVSRQAIAVATELNIPYLRYERTLYQPPAVKQQDSQILELDSFEQLLAEDYLTAQRVLLTVGCKALPQFHSWHQRATLFARILPKVKSLEMAIASGFTGDRLIAIRPPISLATETALWQQWDISLVVTKASGQAGGEDIKRQVAANLDIPLIVISRPPMAYPQQTFNLADVLSFCKLALSFKPQ